MKLLEDLVGNHGWVSEKMWGTGKWREYDFGIYPEVDIDMTMTLRFVFAAHLTSEQLSSFKTQYQLPDIRGAKAELRLEDRNLTLLYRLGKSPNKKHIIAALDSLSEGLSRAGVRPEHIPVRFTESNIFNGNSGNTKDYQYALGFAGATLGALIACIPVLFWEMGYLILFIYGSVVAHLARQGYQRMTKHTGPLRNFIIVGGIVIAITAAHLASLAAILLRLHQPLTFANYAQWFTNPALNIYTWRRLATMLGLLLAIPLLLTLGTRRKIRVSDDRAVPLL